MASPIRWAGFVLLSWCLRDFTRTWSDTRLTSCDDIDRCQGLPSVRRLTLRVPPTANRCISTPKGFPSASSKHEKPAPHTAKKLMDLTAGNRTRGLDKMNPARDHTVPQRELLKCLESFVRSQSTNCGILDGIDTSVPFSSMPNMPLPSEHCVRCLTIPIALDQCNITFWVLKCRPWV